MPPKCVRKILISTRYHWYRTIPGTSTMVPVMVPYTMNTTKVMNYYPISKADINDTRGPSHLKTK